MTTMTAAEMVFIRRWLSMLDTELKKRLQRNEVGGSEYARLTQERQMIKSFLNLHRENTGNPVSNAGGSGKLDYGDDAK